MQLRLHCSWSIAKPHEDAYHGETIRVQPMRWNFQMETATLKTFYEPPGFRLDFFNFEHPDNKDEYLSSKH